MPATEQTWRDGKLLHKVFGVTSLLLLIATIWMFAKDHDREWKQYQDTARKVDIINTEWRTLQYDTEAWHREHEALQERVRQTQAQGIDPKLIQAFILEVENAGDAGLPVRDLTRLNAMNDSLNVAVSEARDVRNGRNADDENEAITSYNERKLAAERARVQLDEARQQIEQAGKKVDEAAEAKVAELEEALDAAEEELQLAEKEVMDAEASVIRQRKLLLSEMDNIVAFAKYEESDRLKTRKFESANLDKAKADLDIAIRDNKDADTMASRQAIVDELKARIDQMTLDYQAASDHRNRLQQIASQARADEDDLSKQLADNGAELDRLRRAIADRETAFFDFYGPIPLPGKRWLEMPILDAFNSPRKVQNLWSDGLEQNYNFKNVRRFDRCTTCHQAMEKTLPGTADKPAYVDESLVTFVIDPESADEDGKASNVGEILGLAIDNFLGVGLEDRGLLDHDDVTISFIVPDSLAAKARQKPEVSGDTNLTATQLRESLFNPNINAFSAVTASSEVGVPGLLVGDVIERIDGDPIRGRDRAIFRLQELERQGKPFEITVRRGLPEPFVSHPRLDLYVGSLSPHKVADFACTICHEGQGSATDFKWASHTPNDERQKKEWAEKYGWFDNHHWIYPMSPQRFIESTCLKCHHDVVELEPSERFPEPPAPTLTHGYNVIRKYGCYGCHEVNGYDGPDKRIGPDMRLEPQFYAAALEIANNPQSGFDNLSEEGQSLVRDLIENPENQIARHKLYQIVLEDKLADEPKLSADIHKRIAPLLKDVEVPGSLAKPGPSLRFVTDKLDDAFLYDWIREPKHFRPSTRMPQFFGLWNHLEGESKAKAQEYEPIDSGAC
ncbi:MAG: hypothetical protein R3C99_17795 [Pirellulaceae bacterium]